MRQKVIKRIKRQIAQEVGLMAVSSSAKAKAYNEGVCGAKKQYMEDKRPALPPPASFRKRHSKESLNKFRQRRRASNTRMRERDIKWLNSLQPLAYEPDTCTTSDP